VSHKEIYEAYLENLEERKQHGFDLAGSRAIEDTAYLLDLSINDVCKAISVMEGGGK